MGDFPVVSGVLRSAARLRLVPVAPHELDHVVASMKDVRPGVAASDAWVWAGYTADSFVGLWGLVQENVVCGASSPSGESASRMRLVFRLTPGASGQGLGVEGAMVMCRFAFFQCGVAEVALGVQSAMSPAAVVASQLGMMPTRESTEDGLGGFVGVYSLSFTDWWEAYGSLE